MNSTCCVCGSASSDCAVMYFGSVCRPCVMSANRSNPNDPGALIMLSALRPTKARRAICNEEIDDIASRLGMKCNSIRYAIRTSRTVHASVRDELHKIGMKCKLVQNKRHYREVIAKAKLRTPEGSR